MKDEQVEYYERRLSEDHEHYRQMLDDQSKHFQFQIERLQFINDQLMKPHLKMAALQTKPNNVYMCFKCAEETRIGE